MRLYAAIAAIRASWRVAGWRPSQYSHYLASVRAQREYDKSSGFTPILPEQYGEWFRPVAANIASVLASDGSYFLNIKPHAEDGERSLYVMDLVLAHKRQWGWRFVDEFVGARQTTACRAAGITGSRMRGSQSTTSLEARQSSSGLKRFATSRRLFDYSPNNPKSTSGSGLLGTGPRGAAVDGGKNQAVWNTTWRNADDHSPKSATNPDGRFAGLARPSNVVEAKSESTEGSHSAPYPRTLVEFFIKAFSDAGDVVFDPFMGSGTSAAAAHVLGRNSYGCEISPAYCDVIIGRMQKLGCTSIRLAGDGRTFREIAAERKSGAPA